MWISIAGIPDDDLVRHHYWYGMGKGGGYRLEHVPSGISVVADCKHSDKPGEVVQKLAVALEEKLRNAGILTAEK